MIRIDLNYQLRVYICLYPATQKPKGTERSSLSAKRGGIKQEEKRRKNWEEVAVLQIEAKRIHAMNRKHRKFVSITHTKAVFFLTFHPVVFRFYTKCFPEYMC